jgi:S-ribosylhomocysteine lyase LuxS involved in autoinducer biosynthesis
VDGKKGNQYNAMKVKKKKKKKKKQQQQQQIHKLLHISSTTLRNHLDLTVDEIYGVFKLYCHPLYT